MEILTFIGLYITALAGMLAHFMKKKIKGETLTAILQWHKNHFKSTMLAFMATTAVFLAYYYGIMEGINKTDFVAIFLIGYSSDSVFNKWDKDIEDKI